ncbi:ribbon-helix-helix protein, CopG family [Nocardioides sp. GXZ039]|uniref:ribbon-helix-helix protein, CopG family n=1 Tax=Nocardioides sp. GXZ039 TaxID=3136018 RepID=UPI0030F478CC
MAFTLRTDDELDAALDRMTQELGLSRQELIRQLVLAEAERRDKRSDLDAVLDSELPRYAVALERLGQ